MQVFIIIINI